MSQPYSNCLFNPNLERARNCEQQQTSPLHCKKYHARIFTIWKYTWSAIFFCMSEPGKTFPVSIQEIFWKCYFPFLAWNVLLKTVNSLEISWKSKENFKNYPPNVPGFVFFSFLVVFSVNDPKSIYLNTKKQTHQWYIKGTVQWNLRWV
jgi:hypothetical protein